MNDQSLVFLLVTVVIIIVVFLALRRLIWWYWGIDKHLINQQEIIALLKAQIELHQIVATQNQRNVSKPVITRNPHPPQP